MMFHKRFARSQHCYQIEIEFDYFQKEEYENSFSLKFNSHIKSNLLVKVKFLGIDNEVEPRYRKMMLSLFNLLEAKKNFFKLKLYGFILEVDKTV